MNMEGGSIENINSCIKINNRLNSNVTLCQRQLIKNRIKCLNYTVNTVRFIFQLRKRHEWPKDDSD